MNDLLFTDIATRPMWSLVASREEYGGLGLPILTVISEIGVATRDMEAGGRAPSEDTSGYRVVRRGDLVVNRLWARFGAYGISSVDGIISPAYWVLRVTSPQLAPKFLHHLLRCSLYRSEIQRLSKDMPPNGFDLPWDQFRSIKVPIRPMRQQKLIADYLDAETARIDALIEKKQQIVELLHERFKSLSTQEMLRGLNPVTGHGDLPSGWARPTLGVLIELQRGHDLPDQLRIEGTIPIISSGGISGHHNRPAALGPGVITGRYGTVGATTFSEGDYWPLNTTLYVKDFRGCDARWVYHLLRALPLDADSAKSAVTGINRNIVGQLYTPKPPLSEQKAIAERIDDAEAAMTRCAEAARRQIDLLRERRQAVITAAVTGQLDMPGLAA